jgi:hypothetical protein
MWGMAIPLDLWERMITGFPRCPIKELRDILDGKSLTNENIKHVRLLLATLENHENEIRALRQEIEHKINMFSSEL